MVTVKKTQIKYEAHKEKGNERGGYNYENRVSIEINLETEMSQLHYTQITKAMRTIAKITDYYLSQGDTNNGGTDTTV
jgi:hypothetical protein